MSLTGGGKIKDFPLFTEQSQFTDDTVMTVAVLTYNQTAEKVRN